MTTTAPGMTTLIDFPPNCRTCGQGYLTPYQLRALVAAASRSKAAGIPAVIADAELEIRRRIQQEIPNERPAHA